MITVLEYLVIAAVIGVVIFLIAAFVFGRGEQMASLSPRTSPSELPDGAIGGDDVRRVRFGLALRGYRMSDVDWTLDRLAAELDRLHRRVAELTGEPLPPGVPAEPAGEDLFGDGRPESGRPGQPDDPDRADGATDADLDAGRDADSDADTDAVTEGAHRAARRRHRPPTSFDTGGSDPAQR